MLQRNGYINRCNNEKKVVVSSGRELWVVIFVDRYDIPSCYHNTFISTLLFLTSPISPTLLLFLPLHRTVATVADARSLTTQIHQLQASRDALLEEVNYLSARNAKLEEDTQAVPRLRQEAQASKKRIEVLLVMLGEKEEEVERAGTGVE